MLNVGSCFFLTQSVVIMLNFIFGQKKMEENVLKITYIP